MSSEAMWQTLAQINGSSAAGARQEVLNAAYQISKLEAENRGYVAIGRALIKALEEVAPGHPLLDKKNRDAIFYATK